MSDHDSSERDETGWCPEALRCDHLVEPLGLGSRRPLLQWRLPPAAGTVHQEAFQLRVTLGAPDPGAAWSGGWVESRQQGARYNGPALSSRQRVRWSVRVRTDDGRTSGWSEAASFELGLLGRGDWSASWIRRPDGAPGVPARAPYLLRRRFSLATAPRDARLYATALGVYELHLNGARVGDALLRPGWTDPRRRLQVEAADVAGLLRSGENVLVAVLAPGWYSGRIATRAEPTSGEPVRTPELLVQLELAPDDAAGADSPGRVVTDERWDWAPSAIRSSDLYDGEDWDLRLAGPLDGSDGWRWQPVEVGTGTAGELVGHRAGPLVEAEVREAVVTFRSDGTALLDSGANDTGFLRLGVRARPGAAIEVTYGEILDPAGNLHRDNLRAARCADTFVCAGAGAAGSETLAPSFSYRGYQYAVVSGLSSPDELVSAEAVALGNGLHATGRFSSSSRLLEQLWDLMVCSLRANYVEVPTDCPQRDERMGWLADAQLFAPVAAYAYDVAAFLSKWVDDILDARTPAGGFPDVAPRPSSTWPGRSFVAGAPSWADAGVLVPWLIYERYGDSEPLERAFPAMLDWLRLVHEANPDGIWRHGRGNDYGDWVPAGPDTSHDLFSTCWLYRSSTVAAGIARLLGDDAAARWLAGRAEAVRAAFHEHYVEAASGRVADTSASPTRSSPAARHWAPVVADETQTGYVLALVLGLLEGETAARAGDRLAALVTEAGTRLSTGFSGSALLLDALERAGHPGLAWELLLRTEPPSLGFMVQMGATSVWERWDGLDEHGWPACPTMNSFNHYAMSSMLRWLVEGACGLRPHAGVPAMASVSFRPAVSRRVRDAAFELDAPAGPLSLGWAWDGEARVVGRVSVPPGMSCHIAGAVSVDDEPRAARRSGDRPGAEAEAASEVGAGEHEVVWTLTR